MTKEIFVGQKRDAGGRFCGKGAFRSEFSAPETAFTPLSEVPEKLRTVLKGGHEALANASARDGRVATVVCRASPGSGKSTMERRLMAERFESGNREHVMYHVPTLSLAEEAAADAQGLGLAAIAVRGRSAANPAGTGTMCAKADLIERASRIGISARDHFCETIDQGGKKLRCPHFAGCPYLAQFQTNATHLFLATSYMSLPAPNGTECDWRVVDETFFDEFVPIRKISAASFTAPREFFPPSKETEHESLLKAASKVLAALIDRRSPVALNFTVEELRGYANLEQEAQAPRAHVAPDQEFCLQSLAVGEAEERHRQVSLFSAIWTILADAREAGLKDTERLRILNKHDKHHIQIMRRKPLKLDQPMLVLDADADEEILRALGCDVLATHDLTLRPNAIVTQLHDRRMTSGALLRQPELRESWRRIVTREVLRDRAARGGGVLVGATRKVVQAFFEDAGHSFEGKTKADISAFMLNTPLHGAHWLWFGGRALGSNRYEECSSVIVIGREELPVEALEDRGCALWGDTPEAPIERIEADHLGNRCMPELEVPYEMTDGSQMAVLVPCHPDHRVRRLQSQSRELATRQLIERLRLARAAYPKRVLLGCNVPIPGIPVDALVSWQDICVERVDAAVCDGLLNQGGVRLSAEGLAQAGPKIFKTTSTAKDHLKRNTHGRDRLKSPGTWYEFGDIQIVRLRMARPNAREEFALVDVQDRKEAEAISERLWGPLRSCSPA